MDADTFASASESQIFDGVGFICKCCSKSESVEDTLLPDSQIVETVVPETEFFNMVVPDSPGYDDIVVPDSPNFETVLPESVGVKILPPHCNTCSCYKVIVVPDSPNFGTMFPESVEVLSPVPIRGPYNDDYAKIFGEFGGLESPVVRLHAVDCFLRWVRLENVSLKDCCYFTNNDCCFAIPLRQ
ncbi:hypothetical protein OROHE_005442 [Orobanche hederae]